MSPARARSCSVRRGPATPGPAPSGPTSGSRRRRRLRPPEPRLPLLDAQEGGPGRDPDGPAVQVPGWPGPDHRRPGSPGEKPKTKVVVQALKAIRRPDLTEAEAVVVEGETKAQSLRRTLDGRSILIGLPGLDPLFYRSARNIEGVQVAPVAEFNTYDILKQRYLVLTREALAVLKERVKQKPARKPGPASPSPSAPSEV